MFNISACSTTRKVPQQDALYISDKGIKVVPKGTKLPSSVKSSLEAITNISPNGSTLLLPFRLPVGLWFYNTTSSESKGIGGWINRHWASPPVLLSAVNPENKVGFMENKLVDLGYFHAQAEYQLFPSSQGKKVRVGYTVRPGRRYYVKDLKYPEPTNYLDSLLFHEQGKGKLQAGDPLVTDALLQERERLSKILHDHGFVDFRKELIQFVADNAGQQVDLELSLSNETADSLLIAYDIETIKVYLDTARQTPYLIDSTSAVGLVFYYHEPYIKWETLSKGMALLPGKKYSITDEKNTFNYLSALGIFRSVYIHYQNNLSDSTVDVSIELTPLDNIRLSYEVDVVTKSNNFTGPGLSVVLGHRNAFGGAEKLDLKLDVNFEWMLGNNVTNQIGSGSYGLGLNIDYRKPGLLLPFHIKLPRDHFAYSDINAGVNLLNRLQYYRMISWHSEFGYHWRVSKSQSFEFRPLDISYTKLIETTPEFDSLLLENPLIRRSFDEQFIFGLSFTSTINHLWRNKNQFYWENTIETAGNLLGLISSIAGDKTENSNLRAQIFKNPYAQFVKLSTDVRYYFHLGEEQRLVSRMFVGLGIPYGNSRVMPYLKQFFAGGSSSVRAFRARSLGPGTYNNLSEDNIYYEQTGDIKIEANVEYRFPLSAYFAGAFFLDAGNIWLRNADPSRPGGQFRWNSFLDEMAIGTGAGFRVDVDFFVLRLDFGYALKEPYRSAGDRWIFGANNYDPSYFLHLAIGYPF